MTQEMEQWTRQLLAGMQVPREMLSPGPVDFEAPLAEEVQAASERILAGIGGTGILSLWGPMQVSRLYEPNVPLLDREALRLREQAMTAEDERIFAALDAAVASEGPPGQVHLFTPGELVGPFQARREIPIVAPPTGPGGGVPYGYVPEPGIMDWSLVAAPTDPHARLTAGHVYPESDPEGVGRGVVNLRGLDRIQGRRVTVPLFEIVEIPSIHLGEIQERRFNMHAPSCKLSPDTKTAVSEILAALYATKKPSRSPTWIAGVEPLACDP